MLFPSELRLDYYPTKSQSNWMCGLYSQRSYCLSYQIFLSVFPDASPCIAFPVTSTVEGGDVNAYFIIHRVQLNVDIFLHTISFECTTKLQVNYLKFFGIFMIWIAHDITQSLNFVVVYFCYLIYYNNSVKWLTVFQLWFFGVLPKIQISTFTSKKIPLI